MPARQLRDERLERSSDVALASPLDPTSGRKRPPKEDETRPTASTPPEALPNRSNWPKPNHDSRNDSIARIPNAKFKL